MLPTAMLLAILLLLLLYLGCRKPKGYPPGPRWWPILGCALEVARLRQETGYLIKTCAVLCKKYGSVIGLKIGNDRIVVINDYDSMRTILTDEDCDGRPIGPVFQVRTWGSRKGLILVDGQLWIEQRRFVLKHLREFGFGRNSMSTIIENEAFHLVQHFKKLFHNKQDNTVNDKVNGSSMNETTHGNDDGQIYKLQKVQKYEYGSNSEGYRGQKNGSTKILKAADMYVKADEYVEVRRVAQSSGIIIPMNNAFGVSVLNTLWQMMAGKRFNTDDRQLKYLQRILSKLFGEVDMIGAPFGHFPILRFIAPEMSGYKSFVEIHQQLWKFLKDELEIHKSTFKPNAPRDLMDVYLEVLNSKDHSETFSESQLLAICIDLFMAGSETTSKTLAFCFLYLVLYPDVQRKAQEEIDRVVGRDRLPTLDDRPRMTYTNAVVIEATRMFMGRNLNVPHRTLRDTTIKGYRIPKNTMLIVNFNAILMDESWGDPEEFRPERFIDECGNLEIPQKYFPFGIARHRCMGEILARSNMFVITAALLQTFTFSVVPGEKKPIIHDFIDGVTAGPLPFRAMLSLRT